MSTDEMFRKLSEVRASAAPKFPPDWDAGAATRRGVAWHFKDPVTGRREHLRAEPESVHITTGGRTIGITGEPIDVGDLIWQIPVCAEGPGLGDRAAELASPFLRRLVLGQLLVLADGPTHRDRWGDITDAAAVHAFDDTINDLFAALDGPKGVDAHDAIGDVMLDAREAAAVDEVIARLNRVIDETGEIAPPRLLLEHPAWPDVVRSAGLATHVIGSGELG